MSLKTNYRKVVLLGLCMSVSTMALADGHTKKVHQDVSGESGTVIKVDGEFPVNLMNEVSAYKPSEAAHYEIKANSTLKETLASWVDLVGYELVWQPEPEEGDVAFARTMAFQGTFEEATADLFSILREQSKFDAQLHSNGVLRVFVANDNK